jgi:hypothetical protein
VVGSQSATATMFQQIPQYLLTIAATGMVLSVIAFVISIFSPPTSIPVIRLAQVFYSQSRTPCIGRCSDKPGERDDAIEYVG